MATSVVSVLDWWARAKPDRVALVFGDDQVDYRRYRDWTSRVARSLVARGVAPGDRVALLANNSLEWAVTAIGVLRAGGVLVPINPRLVAGEIRSFFEEAGVRLVIAEGAFTATLKEVAGQLDGDLDIVEIAAVEALRTGETGGEAGGVKVGETGAFRVDRDQHEPMTVLFTSGSTGRSKGVICTNRTMLDIAFEASLREDALNTGVRTLLVLPLCFTPGVVYGLFMTGILGGTLVIEPGFDAARAVQRLAEHHIQAMFGVPLLWESMARTPGFAEADLSSLGSAVVGGAAVSVPLLRAWGAKGVVLRQIYGMTEVGGIATATLPEEAEEHAATCGAGSPFTDLRVVRPDGTDCEPGEPGEIIMRGPGVTPGYWAAPELTAQAIRDGWLHGGDLGVRDADGRIGFADRLKDLIISGGINISPFELEAALMTIPGISEVAVIAAPDERFGETPAAIVSVAADSDLDEAAIVAACATRMADYKVPRYVVIRRDPLPRLPSGKLAKPAIRDEYRDVTERFPKVR
ncbi:fatty-acid--CoA ligase [Frankia sp. CcI49]|uniref:class I adenylate-forming enzyme family protein n=1 Tax=unclassified Frankia TaxID=2632575 RepID=UPI0006CA3990|nr:MULTISPECIES: AMP-binding protein [unclassified Frankia]KPM52117.1 fatty-acid--CoA ligase [Frankia sp. R43]ONH49964.1 fatty-acid--CoA ligase [Frankia sp. CcI49]